MRYLCLVYIDPDLAAAQTPEEERELARGSIANDESLMASGKLVTAAPLDEPRTARTIKNRNGRITMTDGPFPETKEHLGGFMLVEAASLDEAVEIASSAPVARIGWIEVRRMTELSQ
jgi:hypothetical protein